VINPAVAIVAAAHARFRRSLPTARPARSTLPASSARRLFGHRPEDHPGLDPRAPLQGLPGVVDVSGWPARPKPTSTVDLDKLIDYGLTLPQMLQTSTTATSTSAVRPSISARQAAIVRGSALIHTMTICATRCDVEQRLSGLPPRMSPR